jgi:hypothetical protein
VRRILTGAPLIDNRAVVSVPAILEPGYTDEATTKQRLKTIQDLGDQFNAIVQQILKQSPPTP